MVFAGADVDAADCDGNTPLHFATAHDDHAFVNVLLGRGANANVINSGRYLALQVEIEHDRVAVVEALLKAGADPKDSCFGSLPPLYLAAESLAMTRTLLEHGADVNAVDDDYCTALNRAVQLEKPDVVDALVKAGADLEMQMWSCCDVGAPLHFAAGCRGDVECISVLVRHGANVNAQDEEGRTPLHGLCDSSYRRGMMSEAADLLLRWGADETITDRYGETAMDLIYSGESPLRRLFANAPAGRAWRRRGMLVMCRAYSDRARSSVGKGRVDRAPSEQKVKTGVAGACRNEGSGELARVVGLEVGAIFRTIICFL